MVTGTELKETYKEFLDLKNTLATEVHELCSEYDEECEVQLSIITSCPQCEDTDYIWLCATLDKHMPLSALVKIEEKGGTFVKVIHNEESECCGFCKYIFHFHLTDTIHCSDNEVS